MSSFLLIASVSAIRKFLFESGVLPSAVVLLGGHFLGFWQVAKS